MLTLENVYAGLVLLLATGCAVVGQISPAKVLFQTPYSGLV